MQMAIGLIVATNTMFTGAVRHIYGMSRDGQFPFSRTFARTLADGSPWAAVLLVGDEPYFGRFGFVRSTARLPGPVDPRRVLIRMFGDHAPLEGDVRRP